MEAFAVAASVLQVATVGLALAQVIYSICDDASSANEQVKDLAFYVRSTSSVLEEIGKIFQDEKDATRPIVSQTAISNAQEICDKVELTFASLQEIVTSTERSSVGLFKFMLKNSRVKLLQLGLAEMRSNLQCMMQVIIYARLKAVPASTVNELEQRNLIANLIQEHLKAADQLKHANVQASTAQAAGASSSSITPQQCDPVAQKTTTAIAQQPPSPKPMLLASHAPISAATIPTKPNSPIKAPTALAQTTREATPPVPVPAPAPAAFPTNRDPPDQRISYLLALYIVCCPCLSPNQKLKAEDRADENGRFQQPP
ncbi:hypothetical protein BJY04DRAFT_223339 [Aspergillus karnatakaensis]|uniref:uncharacterized protein n=1 Tax=Aspergillus karnatakaensis TaxID=1810916 RepID=UPI003CCD0C32